MSTDHTHAPDTADQRLIHRVMYCTGRVAVVILASPFQ